MIFLYYFTKLFPVPIISLQGITILWRIYEQTSAHIFFIDWEQPKGYVKPESTTTPLKYPPSAFRQIRLCEHWNRMSVSLSLPSLITRPQGKARYICNCNTSYCNHPAKICCSAHPPSGESCFTSLYCISSLSLTHSLSLS